MDSTDYISSTHIFVDLFTIMNRQRCYLDENSCPYLRDFAVSFRMCSPGATLTSMILSSARPFFGARTSSRSLVIFESRNGSFLCVADLAYNPLRHALSAIRLMLMAVLSARCSAV
mmetsp:Transcript_27645/g.55337  ORF Transcript_27645/g.55337 Transcript_27645/m.55337 type:complete len:116 (+) Transcript_27645:344-691(+)